MSRFLTFTTGICLALSINRGYAQSTFFDFGSGLPSQFSGAGGITSVQGFAGLGHSGNQFAGNLLRNTATGNPASATILTLTNLAPHTSVSIGFLLAAIDSWDSTNGTANGTPDFFNVSVDGALVFQTTFANASGSVTYSGDDIGNGLQQRGFTNGSFWLDRAFDMNSEVALQNIPHTASTLTVRWFASGAGWQGGTDESWANDNVRLSVGPTAVPEPGTFALILAGSLVGVSLARRQRRK